MTPLTYDSVADVLTGAAGFARCGLTAAGMVATNADPGSMLFAIRDFCRAEVTVLGIIHPCAVVAARSPGSAARICT